MRISLGVFWSAALWCVATGCARFTERAPKGPLTSVDQIRRLTPRAVAAQVPVHLHGTVTFSDTSVLLLLIQDPTGAIRIEGAPLAGLPLEPGRTVDLTGVVTSGEPSPVVACSIIRMEDGRHPLPEPIHPDAKDLVSARLQYRYVELEGVVKSVVVDHAGRVSLVIRALGRNVKVSVRDLGFSDYRSLLDAGVRVQGALGTSFDARGIPIGVRLWVRTVRDIQVATPAPGAADVPVWTVGSILAADRAHLPQHRIRLHGSISLEEGRLVLRDSTGAVPLRAAQSGSIVPGGPTDILGFASEEAGSVVLTACTSLDLSPERQNPAPLPVLTAVGQVKGLSEDRARLGYPVRLRGVVTYHNPIAGNTFVQDSTGGVYLVFRREAQPQVRAGDSVELEGVSRSGNFAPVVVVSSVRVIGRQPLPQPLRIDPEEFFTGIADSTWVEARGVVHSMGQENGLRTLGVNWGVHHFKVYLFGSAKLPDSILDSHVRLQGVCGSKFNFKRQILGMQLFVPDASLVHIEGDAPHSPPLRDIEQLLQYSPASHFGERSRIRGVVTLTQPSGPTYVDDSTGGVLIQDHAPVPLAIGDSVEVTGFAVAVPGLFNPVLRDAEIRKLGHPGPPGPTLVTATDILDEGRDAHLVQLDAVLVDQGAAKGNQALVLQAGDRLFDARIDRQRLPSFEKGSLLRVTGITAIETYESQQTVLPRSFSLLLRSPADIVVLRPAPWWTTARTFRLLGFMCAVALLAVAWIVVLRRRVRQQTADLRGSRQMLQLVFDHIPQRVFWKDREGRFLGCNRALAADAGLAAPQDIVGHTDRDLVWKELAEHYEADDREVMETGRAKIGYEETQVGADGVKRWLRTSKAPLPDSDGCTIGVLGTYEDITESKHAEERLQRYSAELAETNEELKRFTYIVSHDLRAPLVSLKGFSTELRYALDTLRKPFEAMLASIEEPERTAVAQALQDSVPEALGFIESSVTRMDHLIAALLRLSRVGYREFHMEELDSGALLEETLRSLAHQIESRNIQVKAGPLPRIASDRTAIEQIFGNLLDNAVKYLDPQRPGEIEVSAEERAEAFVFHVRDNGRGIADEDMDKVFAPFRRAGAQDVPGEGMGLAYVRALLHRLDGRIDCHSQPGVGTTFTFTLPKVV
jgi:PAS domain S-box-containing protein